MNPQQILEKPLQQWTDDDLYVLGSKIYKEKNYGKTIIRCGFVKTSSSGALFAVGVTLIFNTLTNHPMFRGWHEAGLFFGGLSIFLAFFIIYVIDKRRAEEKKKEFGEIKKREIELKEETKKEAIDEFGTRAYKIAEEVGERKAKDLVDIAMMNQLKTLRFEDECQRNIQTTEENENDEEE